MLTRTASIFLLALASLSGGGAPNSKDLAVIVNKQTAVLGTSARELKGIFLGSKDKWPNGTKVVAVTLSLEHPETRAWLKEICEMSEQEYKKYFMQMNFQGKTVNLPHLLGSATQVRAMIAATPGAIGIVPLHDVDATVNVLSVDGSAPGTPGYKLATVTDN